jgi:hypothetical protein
MGGDAASEVVARVAAVAEKGAEPIDPRSTLADCGSGIVRAPLAEKLERPPAAAVGVCELGAGRMLRAASGWKELPGAREAESDFKSELTCPLPPPPPPMLAPLPPPPFAFACWFCCCCCCWCPCTLHLGQLCSAVARRSPARSCES